MAEGYKYNPDYHVKWAWSLYARGATDQEVADAFGINRRTITRWRNDYPEFKEACEITKGMADSLVEASLYKKATGYTSVTKETRVTIDNEGNQKPAEIKKIEREVDPDTGAIAFWLKNRKPDEWRDRREEVITASIDRVVIDEVEGYINGTDSGAEKDD